MKMYKGRIKNNNSGIVTEAILPTIAVAIYLAFWLAI